MFKILNEKMHSALHNRKNKLESKILKNGEPKLSTYLLLVVIASLIGVVSSFSSFLGVMANIALGIYALKKCIIPLARKIEMKAINFFLNSQHKMDFSDKFAKVKKKVSNVIRSSKEKCNEKKNDAKSKIGGAIKKTGQKIKNLSVASVTKFKDKMCIKRDSLGTKIVSGSYHLKKHQIIQELIDLKQIRKFMEYTESEQEKIKVKFL